MPKITARGVQIALGFFWLLDGALQLQHQMFTKAFVTQVIQPATVGQPRFVSGPMNFAIHIFLLHPAIFNSLFAATQLGIGLLILYRPTVKLGLIFSILWGLVVWIFGEGYGGIFSGHTLLLMGAPGAASLYVLLALGVMPRKKKYSSKKGNRIAYWLVFVWAILWLGGGIYLLLPGQNSTSDVSAMIAGNADGTPGWLTTADTNTANFIQRLGKPHSKTESPAEIASSMNMNGTQMRNMTNGTYTQSSSDQGYIFILFAAIIQMLIGIGVLFKSISRKLAIYIGFILALFFWVIGQSLGSYYSGLATDPNTGPLIILLGLAIMGSNNLDKKLARLYSKGERLLTGRELSTAKI